MYNGTDSGVKTYDMVIDGKSTSSDSGDYLICNDPATEDDLAEVPSGIADDIDRAVKSARDAFDEWYQHPHTNRGQLLYEFAKRIRNERDRLARLESLETGKPISLAKTAIDKCADYFEYFAGLADKIHGESIPVAQEYVDYTVREPLGVTAQILPWNFPVTLFGRSTAPALATGNAVVVKPAEQTPITTIELAKLSLDVGFPPGVINVVTGFGAEAGASLAGHEDVDGVSFTGSVVTGKEVAKLAAENVTSVHLELGGKSPNVVFPDADLPDVVDNIITSIFTMHSGQICSAGSRLLVHENIHEEVINRLVEQTEKLNLGRGLNDPDMGPLASQEQFEKVLKYIRIGREEVGEPVTGGNAPDRTGYFVEPTIFDGVNNDDRIAQEEIFGPVLSVIGFEDEDQAIALANEVEYGLVAGIFTQDIGRAHRFAREVDAGQIFINEWFAGGVETPFGGYKQSGYGRERGIEAIESYTQVKNVCSNISY